MDVQPAVSEYLSTISFLQAWQATHPSARGRSFFGRRPAVHNGFLKSYLANGFSERIVNKVLDVVRSNDWPHTQVRSTTSSASRCLTSFDFEAGQACLQSACHSLWHVVRHSTNPKKSHSFESFSSSRFMSNVFHTHLFPLLSVNSAALRLYKYQDDFARSSFQVDFYRRP